MEETLKKERDFLRIGIQESFLCSEFLVKYLEKGDERDGHLVSMEQLVQNYCLLDNHLDIRPPIINRMAAEERDKLNKAESKETPDPIAKQDYSQTLNEKVTSAISNINLENHTKLKDYKKKVAKLVSAADRTEGDGDELMVTDESDSLIDPLTKTILVDPVISLKCRHRYSRRSIMNHLKGSSQCPYVGCRSKFTADELEDDVIGAQTLRRQQLQQMHR